MNVLSKMMQVPAFGKIVLNALKKNAFAAFQVPLENALEKQTKALQAKFKRMENTEMGTKLHVHQAIGLENVPFTNYDFYAPFYNSPSPKSFMYPIEDYLKVKTSGTTGTDKLFLIPRIALKRALRETGLPVVFALFHDGQRIALEYGDTMYLNLGPAPFISGMFNLGSSEKSAPFLNLVPNINLSYREKVDYFILNHKTIDAAWLTASAIVTQVMPKIGEPIKLKGLMLIDDLIAKAYRDEITRFVGVPPKTLYASTETIAPTIPSVQHSMSFIFDPRRGVFEFVKLEKTETEKEEKPVGLNGVKVGNVYRLIYTDLIGELTRYDTANSFKCTAKGDDALCSDFPVFEFQARLDKTIAIMNFTRIDEKELLEAFQHTGIQFTDFTARINREGSYEYLYLYVELRGKITAKDLENEIHKTLYATDKDYKMLVDLFEYTPIRVELLPKGTFAKYLEKRSGAYPKVCRINMNEEEFDRLISLVRSNC
jgi:hypothetical protein